MKRILYPTFLIVLAMAFYALYTKPLYGELKLQFAKETEVRNALVEADKAQAQLDEIKKRFESFPADADERLSQLLPEKIDPIRLLIDSTEFLERNGFSSETLSVSHDGGGGASSGPYRIHRISFSISSSYDTFREFLNILESSLVLRDTSTVSFSTGVDEDAPKGSRPELAIHTYNIEIKGYSLH